METKEFFPKVAIVDANIVFNAEAVQTMELDTKDAKVMIIKAVDPEKEKNKTEILIMKVNGSLCDDIESVKEVVNPDLIRPVTLKYEDNEIESAHITMPKTSIDKIKKAVETSSNEYKLLVCNMESPLGKEFREQFDIQGNYYKLVNVNDKRVSIGKEKGVKPAEEIIERVKINE